MHQVFALCTLLEVNVEWLCDPAGSLTHICMIDGRRQARSIISYLAEHFKFKFPPSGKNPGIENVRSVHYMFTLYAAMTARAIQKSRRTMYEHNPQFLRQLFTKSHYKYARDIWKISGLYNISSFADAAYFFKTIEIVPSKGKSKYGKFYLSTTTFQL